MIPKKIRVLGRDYKISFLSERKLKELALKKNTRAALGLAEHHTAQIFLNKDLDPQQVAATLTHEITHCIGWEMNQFLTEEEVERTSRGFYAVLRDNPRWW